MFRIIKKEARSIIADSKHGSDACNAATGRLLLGDCFHSENEVRGKGFEPSNPLKDWIPHQRASPEP